MLDFQAVNASFELKQSHAMAVTLTDSCFEHEADLQKSFTVHHRAPTFDVAPKHHHKFSGLHVCQVREEEFAKLAELN